MAGIPTPTDEPNLFLLLVTPVIFAVAGRICWACGRRRRPVETRRARALDWPLVTRVTLDG
jgi:hypothetical protein